jgi:hypothetical protein
MKYLSRHSVHELVPQLETHWMVLRRPSEPAAVPGQLSGLLYKSSGHPFGVVV